MAPDRIRFGDFELDAANFTLRRGVTRIKLERIPMTALILLARNQGRLVKRAELVEAIWGKDYFLESDTAINTAIRKLRRVLGDDPKQPTYIETMPGNGYRFLPGNSGLRPEEAKALYSRGLHFWNRKTPELYMEAIRLYQESIDLDPDYPLPYVGLAKTWIMLGIHGLQPAHEVYPRARAAVAKALSLDSGIAEGHAALGDIEKGYEWRWASAESHYRRALELDPQCGIAHQWYANLLSIVERHDEALDHARQARALDPMSVGPAGFVGFTYYRARRFREALRESEGALTLEPNSPIANWFLGHVLMALHRFAEAVKAFSTAVNHSREASMYLAALTYAHAAAGDAVPAEEILATLQRRGEERYVSPLDMAIALMAAGRMDAAFECLETAVEQRVMRLTELRMPMFDFLRSDSRYQLLLARIGLPVK
jgi:DNA-binding winged helix-turn-helix (wHTH) protein/Tfp pilus assembly protein PilF